jgi:hypothetical protein
MIRAIPSIDRVNYIEKVASAYREKKPLFCRVADIDERYTCSSLLRTRGEALEVVHNTAEHELCRRELRHYRERIGR